MLEYQARNKFCSKGCAARFRVKQTQLIDKGTLIKRREPLDISLEYGVSVVTIYNYLKKFGIPARDVKFIDFTGKRIGQMIVLERATLPLKGGGKHVKWRCRCDCGNEHIAFSHHLSRSISVRCTECSHKAHRSPL